MLELWRISRSWAMILLSSAGPPPPHFSHPRALPAGRQGLTVRASSPSPRR